MIAKKLIAALELDHPFNWVGNRLYLWLRSDRVFLLGIISRDAQTVNLDR